MGEYGGRCECGPRRLVHLLEHQRCKAKLWDEGGDELDDLEQLNANAGAEIELACLQSCHRLPIVLIARALAERGTRHVRRLLDVHEHRIPHKELHSRAGVARWRWRHCAFAGGRQASGLTKML